MDNTISAMRAAAEQELVQHTLAKRVTELQGSMVLQLIQAAPAVTMNGRAAPAPPPPPVGQQLDVRI
jgi:hypothetical protein